MREIVREGMGASARLEDHGATKGARWRPIRAMASANGCANSKRPERFQAVIASRASPE